MTTWQCCLDSLQIQYSLQMQPKEEDVRSESWRALHENWSSFLWLWPWSGAYMSELILTVAPIIFTWKQIWSCLNLTSGIITFSFNDNTWIEIFHHDHNTALGKGLTGRWEKMASTLLLHLKVWRNQIMWSMWYSDLSCAVQFIQQVLQLLWGSQS